MCCKVGGPNHNLHMREKRRIKKSAVSFKTQIDSFKLLKDWSIRDIYLEYLTVFFIIFYKGFYQSHLNPKLFLSKIKQAIPKYKNPNYLWGAIYKIQKQPSCSVQPVPYRFN